MTTVIGAADPDKFKEWEKKKGKERADYIKLCATDRGTKLHKVIEVYLENGDYQSLDEYQEVKIQWMFKSAKFYLDIHFDNIVCQERRMLSRRLGVAGTTDYIGDFTNELTVVDYKGSMKEKPEEWIEDYFVQLAGYWAMFSETTGVVPKKLVVFLMTEQMEIQIVERRNIMYYLEKLRHYVNLFTRQHSYDA
jgi:genome maintenance exonuclease 1